jgi:MFS family permease
LDSFNGEFNTIDDPSWVPFQDLLACGVRKIPIKALPVLVVGYGLGVGTNLLLAFLSGSLGWLVAAIILSGVYIAIEETLEKAVAAELLPRERRSLGFGILACGNAVGDMVSSLYVGLLLEAGYTTAAFGIAAAFGAVGVCWMLWFIRRKRLH